MVSAEPFWFGEEKLSQFGSLPTMTLMILREFLTQKEPRVHPVRKRV